MILCILWFSFSVLCHFSFYPLTFQVILAHQDLQDPQDLWVRLVIQVQPVHRATAGRSVQQVQLEQLDEQDLLVARDPLVGSETRALRASEDLQGIMDPQVSKVFKDLLVLLVHQASLVFQVHLDREDLLGQLDHLEEPGFQVSFLVGSKLIRPIQLTDGCTEPVKPFGNRRYVVVLGSFGYCMTKSVL